MSASVHLSTEPEEPTKPASRAASRTGENKHTAGQVAGAVGKGVAVGCYEIVRQIPYLAVVGILLAIVGSILTGHGLDRIGKSLGGAGIDLELVGRLLAVVRNFPSTLTASLHTAVLKCLLSDAVDAEPYLHSN
jgi:hypothetical protein